MKHLLLLFLAAVVLFFIAAIIIKNCKGIYKNLLLGIFSILFSLLFLEGVFCFVPKTSNYGKTLAREIWEDYYWRINKEGFRDEEYSKKNSNKKKLVFIGDSFTAGQGINNPANRYSDLIGLVVKDSFEFYNAGFTGSNTDIKTEILASLTFKPDVVIYQYFFDDIADTRIRFDSTATAHQYPYANYPHVITYAIENSYLINYLYWLYPHFELTQYLNFLISSYSNPKIAAEHDKLISKMIAYTKANNIRLVFLTIPMPSLYGFSNQCTKKIEQLVQDSAIMNINVTAALDTFPNSELIVNKNDFHLNEKGNRIVANEILEKVFGIKKQQIF
jgi:lysophospholipase L1-like esterase